MIADADGSGGVSFEVRSVCCLVGALMPLCGQEFCAMQTLPEETMVDIARAAMAEFFGVALFQVQ